MKLQKVDSPKEGDRVFTYNLEYQKREGTIHKNTEYPAVSDWYIKYDNGHEFAVTDIERVYIDIDKISIKQLDPKEIIKELPSVKVGMDRFYGEDTVLNVINKLLIAMYETQTSSYNHGFNEGANEAATEILNNI